MSDAREIIAQYLCERAGQGWSGISTFERAAYRTAAHGMIATFTAAGYRILGPDELDALQKALSLAEDGAGTLPAKEAVKLCPTDWHALSDLVRALGRKA